MIRFSGSTRRTATVLTVVALLAGATGCGGGRSASTATGAGPSVGQRMAPSLTVLFQQALKRPKLSPFEREAVQRAVATGRLAAADYEEAHSRYARCMKDSGFVETYTKLPSGIYQVQGSVPAGMSEKTFEKTYGPTTLKCSYPVIDSLYGIQQSNPDLLANPFELAARCLVKAGLVPATYTADAVKKDAETGFAKAPFAVDGAAAHDCLYTAGFAVSRDR